MFEDPPTDAVDCSTQEEVASSLDLSGVEVYDDSGLITFRVHTNGPPAQILDPATGDWSGAVVVDVALPGDVYTTMIAQVHEGDPLVGILDPATGETTPNGVVIADGFVDFGHRFEPPPEEYQVRIQSFHSMGPEEPVACDYMELTVP
jgi:hypothetical protein